MKLQRAFLSVALLIILSGCASEAPIPDHVYFIDPPADIGENRGFIGSWKGDWKGIVGHRLYVEEIMGSYAKVIVSTGWISKDGYFDIEEGYQEMQGTFIGKDITVTIEQEKMNMQITYTLNDHDTISAFGKFHVKGASKPYEIKTILHREKNGKHKE